MELPGDLSLNYLALLFINILSGTFINCWGGVGWGRVVKVVVVIIIITKCMSYQQLNCNISNNRELPVMLGTFR